MNRLLNKVALVTGSAGGIGRGIAIRFAQEGAKVGVLDLSSEISQRVVDDIGRSTHMFRHHSCRSNSHYPYCTPHLLERTNHPALVEPLF